MKAKCSSCGVRNAIGGSYNYGRMRDLCLPCTKALLRAGKCPLCGFGMKTKTHQRECVQTPQAHLAS